MPPDPLETARPVTVLTTSCGSDVSPSPPHLATTTSHGVGEGGQYAHTPDTTAGVGRAGGEMQLSEGETNLNPIPTTTVTTTTTPAANLYLLTPALREAFKSVGATDRSYTFREVLLLLKNYLFSKTHLFDASDKLWVNCSGDPLGVAFQLTRFHYNQVRFLISKSLIHIQGVQGGNEGKPVTPVVPQGAAGGPSTIPYPVAEKTVNAACVARGNVTNDSTGLVVHNRTSLTPGFYLSQAPGPSRGTVHAGPRTKSLLNFNIEFPDVPDGNSDVESVFSYQGYETAYCRNTEFETSEEEEVGVEVDSEAFEEYELASDDARDDNKQSDDSDSMIEDVAMVACALVHEGSGGEDADDSDTEDQSGEDPELVGERWDCLTCGLKNRPFIRYCGKCWQLRKNWLPDRPKKRKRKPRPKKRHLRKRTVSMHSEDQSCERTTQSLTAPLTFTPPLSSSISRSDICFEGELSRTSSNASTVSLKAVSPERPCHLYQHNSQDSGICVSQDFAEEMSMDTPATVVTVETFTLVKAGTSSGSQAATPETSKTKPASSSRKRRLASSEDVKSKKRLKPAEENEEEEIFSSNNFDAKANNFFQSLQTSKGREWLKSFEGREWLQAGVTRASRSSGGVSYSLEADELESSQLCSICCLRPKNASIIHGRLSHQATCYQCARRLLNAGACCPVCRRKIHMVCKHIVV